MKTLILIILCHSGLSFSQSLVEDTPYIKRQVKFWRQVFLNTSVGQTIVHDRFEPSIVYKTVDHFHHNNYRRLKATRKAKRKVKAILRSISKKKFKNLNLIEKRILAKIPPKFRKNFGKRLRGVRNQQGMKEGFKAGLERSFTYIDKIREIFRETGVPEDIAFLPHVESSFNYKAYSKVGAAGIWQFMPASAKLYQLKADEVTDERLDPLKATRAAARMLKDNFKILKSWPLAITAYNYGPGGLHRASRRLKTKSITKVIKNYKKNRFSFASRNFYGSFLAARSIAKDYEKYFTKLNIPAPISLTSIILKDDVYVSDFANKYELRLKEFRNLNPFVKRASIKKDLKLKKGTKLFLPKESVNEFTNFPKFMNDLFS